MTSNYFLYDFAKQEYSGKSRSFEFIVWTALRNFDIKGRISKHIEEELNDLDTHKKDFKSDINQIIKSENCSFVSDRVDAIPKINSLQVKKDRKSVV